MLRFQIESRARPGVTTADAGRASPSSRRGEESNVDPTDSPDLVAALSEGDRREASRFVRRHDPYLGLIIQMRLIGRRLGRRRHSVDAGQSALAGFFRHVAPGRYGSLSSE